MLVIYVCVGVLLASCWVWLAQGDRNKYQEAVYKYEELVDKYSKWSVLLMYVCMYYVCVLL